MSIAVQYTIVALIVLCALIWLCVSSHKRRKEKKICRECAMSETCGYSFKANKKKSSTIPSNGISSIARNSRCSATQYRQPEQEKQ